MTGDVFPANTAKARGWLSELFSVLFPSCWSYLSIVVVKTKKKNKSEKLLLRETGKSQGQRHDWDLKVPSRPGFESQPCFPAAVLRPRATEVLLSLSGPAPPLELRSTSRPRPPGLLEDLVRCTIRGTVSCSTQDSKCHHPHHHGSEETRPDQTPPRNHGVSEPQGPLLSLGYGPQGPMRNSSCLVIDSTSQGSRPPFPRG